jgi:hypothetical protein
LLANAEPELHFACSRCAHRQSADVLCDACGNVVVQDLRSSTARKMLYEAEARWMRTRQARCIAAGVALGVVMYLVSFVIYFDPSAPWSIWRAGLAFASGIGTGFSLERKFGQRRRFPYLDDYEFPSDRARRLQRIQKEL